MVMEMEREGSFATCENDREVILPIAVRLIVVMPTGGVCRPLGGWIDG